MRIFLSYSFEVRVLACDSSQTNLWRSDAFIRVVCSSKHPFISPLSHRLSLCRSHVSTVWWNRLQPLPQSIAAARSTTTTFVFILFVNVARQKHRLLSDRQTTSSAHQSLDLQAASDRQRNELLTLFRSVFLA